MVSFWKSIVLISIVFIVLFVTIIFADAEGLISAPERSSPGDWIKEDQIRVYSDHINLDIKNANWSKFTNTNSMDPFLDEASNAIEIMPESPEDIQVGDIISYETVYGILIHRVTEIGEDGDGIYYIMKGDNNTLRDPFKVRFSDVHGVLVAIIY